MSLVRRLFGLLAGTAGLIGLSACIIGIVGCWWLHGLVDERLARVYGRIDHALAGITGDVAGVRERLRQVGRDLDAVRQDLPDRASRPSNGRAGRRALAGKAMAAAGQQLGDVKPQLVRAVEFGVVVNGLLDALADLWLAERAGIDTDRLNRASDQLSELIGKAQKWAAAIDGPDDVQAPDEATRLAEAVGRVVAILEEAAGRAEDARDRSAARQARVRRFVTTAAWVATAVLIWVGLGQLSLFLHGRGLIRHS